MHIPTIESTQNASLLSALNSAIDNKTKPIGSLGMLEQLARQIGLIQQTSHPQLAKPTILVFAGDHGIVAENISAYPQSVTWQMVENFLAGGAAINVFARQNGFRLQVIDAGVNHDFGTRAGLIDRKVGPGTRNFSVEPAMTREQCQRAMEHGMRLVDELDTGGLHEDGFADVCDGFGGGYTTERVLEIMKDSRLGAFGAMGLLMMLGLKCTTLANATVLTVVAALWVAHPLSRAIATALIWRLPYAKAEGKAKPLAQEMSTREFMISACTAMAVVLFVGFGDWLSWRALAGGIALALFAAWWLARFFCKRIGGYTGDCLGAVQQVSELAFYLGTVAFVKA